MAQLPCYPFDKFCAFLWGILQSICVVDTTEYCSLFECPGCLLTTGVELNQKTVILSLCYKLIMSISAAKAIILSICNFNIPRLDSSPRPPVLGEMGKCPKFCLKI